MMISTVVIMKILIPALAFAFTFSECVVGYVAFKVTITCDMAIFTTVHALYAIPLTPV